LLAHEPGEFYARLADALRHALPGARARTPRELSAAPPDGAAAARWREFWARAEAAEYAAASIPEDERRADLAFVTGLLRDMRGARARGGGGDAA
jgi:hypothetical protein